MLLQIENQHVGALMLECHPTGALVVGIALVLVTEEAVRGTSELLVAVWRLSGRHRR